MTQRCSVPDCDREFSGRDYCSLHYQRWRRHGSPTGGRALAQPRSGPCELLDCSKPVKARGLCNSHLHRLYRYGDPTHVERVAHHGVTDDERFSRHVTPCDEIHCDCSGCLLFDIPCNVTGYGQFHHAGRNTLAHRWAYEQSVGPIPRGMHLDHVHDRGCRHRNCVNVAHLEPVTPSENLRRAYQAGRPRRGPSAA